MEFIKAQFGHIFIFVLLKEYLIGFFYIVLDINFDIVYAKMPFNVPISLISEENKLRDK